MLLPAMMAADAEILVVPIDAEQPTEAKLDVAFWNDTSVINCKLAINEPGGNANAGTVKVVLAPAVFKSAGVIGKNCWQGVAPTLRIVPAVVPVVSLTVPSSQGPRRVAIPMIDFLYIQSCALVVGMSSAGTVN